MKTSLIYPEARGTIILHFMHRELSRLYALSCSSRVGRFVLFRELQREEKGTLLVISHQERILSIADEIVVIADGKVKQAGPREEILPQLLAQPHMACCPQGKVEVGYE